MPPNAISSLWLPRSAMPEGVNTTISFALFMVESLCATIMQVRPLACLLYTSDAADEL